MQPFVTLKSERIGVRMDSRWFGSLDPDPHWGYKKARSWSGLKTIQILNAVLTGPVPYLRIHKSKLRIRLYRIRFRNDGLIFVEGEHFRDLSWRPVEIQFFSSKILCSYYSSIKQPFYIGRGIVTLPVRDCGAGIDYHQFNQFNSFELPLIFKLAVEMYFIILGYYQCCGSMTFWYRSGSADPCLWLIDPYSDPDPAIFVIDLQDANKNKF